MDSVRLEAKVCGRVQGVGFRVFTRRVAQSLGVAGGVRNGDDGAVYVVAEGPRQQLESLLAALHIGPHGGHVDQVEMAWGETSGLDGPFEVWR